MSKKQSIESKIRDWLEQNLDFIDSNLSLIKKEQYLPDTIGASGRLDILCKDQYDNFVIIEIKRSEDSAREAVSEILKYRSLIQHNFRAKDSEIRIIIVSTVWRELIRPFSEAVLKTGYDITGYAIEINDQLIPVAITEVKPLPTAVTRQFIYFQALFLFESAQQRDAFYLEFKSYLLKNNLTDFVLVQLKNLNNELVYYPYAFVGALQKRATDELLEYIKLLDEELFSELFSSKVFDGEGEYERYIEARFIDALDLIDHEYESEVCYPSKFASMIGRERWDIETIEKFGLFDKDPRYSNDLLLLEMQGTDGASKTTYSRKTDSKQKERFEEIISQSRNCLHHTPVWLETIDAIMELLSKETRRFTLSVDIFNPTSFMVALYHAVLKKETAFLPVYYIHIEYADTDTSEMYHGSIRWSGQWPQSDFVTPFDTSENGDRVYMASLRPDNAKESKAMELGYTTTKYAVKAGVSKFAGFFCGCDKKLIEENNYLYSFEQFAVTFEKEMDTLVKNYQRSYLTMGDPK